MYKRQAHLLSKDKIERLLELSKEQPVIFSSDSEDVISSEEMDKENIKKLENQTDIKVFRLTNPVSYTHLFSEERSEVYWTGWALAEYQWDTCRPVSYTHLFLINRPVEIPQ